MTPEDLRDDVPALDDVTYLNFGASGPSPRRVVDAAETALEYHEYDAPSREGMYPAAFESYDDVRETVADFVGASPAEIALTQSTTDAINRVACAFEWEPGDVVVRTDLEHPAGILPWERLRDRRGVEVRIVESNRGHLDLDAYRDAVDGAKLVLFSSLTWNYGTVQPVRELVDIAHDAGAFVLVDAVQMPGQLRMDVTDWGADAVAAAGHKWLLGTWGGGFLYVDRTVADSLVPGSVGYRGVESPTESPVVYEPGAKRFEIGTTSPAPHAALGEAITISTEIGIETLSSRIRRRAERLVGGVPDERLLSPAEPASGLVTIDVDDPEATVERLRSEGIVVRSIPDPHAVRVSVHAVTTESEVDAVLDALAPAW